MDINLAQDTSAATRNWFPHSLRIASNSQMYVLRNETANVPKKKNSSVVLVLLLMFVFMDIQGVQSSRKPVSSIERMECFSVTAMPFTDSESAVVSIPAYQFLYMHTFIQ
jgi:hypothetical protein